MTTNFDTSGIGKINPGENVQKQEKREELPLHEIDQKIQDTAKEKKLPSSMGNPENSLSQKHELKEIKERKANINQSSDESDQTPMMDLALDVNDLLGDVNDLFGDDLMIFSKGTGHEKSGTLQEEIGLNREETGVNREETGVNQEEMGASKVSEEALKKQEANAQENISRKENRQEIRTYETLAVKSDRLEQRAKNIFTIKHVNGHVQKTAMSDLNEKDFQTAVDKRNLFTFVNGQLKVHPQSGYRVGQILPMMGENGQIEHITIDGFMTKEESEKILADLKEYQSMKFTQNMAVLYKAPLEEIKPDDKKGDHVNLNQEKLVGNPKMKREGVETKEWEKTTFKSAQTGDELVSLEKSKEKKAEREKDEKQKVKADVVKKDWQVFQGKEATNTENEIHKEKSSKNAITSEKENEDKKDDQIMEEGPPIPSSQTPKPNHPKEPPRDIGKRKRRFDWGG